MPADTPPDETPQHRGSHGDRPRDRKEIARRILDAFNTGNTDIIDQAFGTNFRSRTTPFPGVDETREGLKREVHMLREAFPGAKFTVDDVIEQGNTVTIRWTMRGRHQRPILGVPASDAEIVQHGEEVLEFDGDMIHGRRGRERGRRAARRHRPARPCPARRPAAGSARSACAGCRRRAP